ncbi:hypothetical protein N2152v2_005490 [Parachlorella kessleri]
MRQPKGPFAGLRSENPLFVFGVAAAVHDDPEVAREVEACLQLCWGQDHNLTDRFDARLLLDEAAVAAPTVSHRHAASREPQAEVTQEQLEYERYRDLDYSREHELRLHGRAVSAPGGPEGSLERSDGEETEDDDSYEGALPPPPGFAAIPFSYGTDDGDDDAVEAPGPAQQQPQQQLQRSQGAVRDANGGNGNGFHAVGFSYDAAPDGPPAARPEQESGRPSRPASQQATALPVPGPDEPAFVPRFLVPEHLRRSMPATERHFKVVQQTASFVREGGGQLEILLRVKQAGNPLFSFLLPADPLHAFYRWLVETRPQELVVIDAAPAAEGERQTAAQQAGQQRQAPGAPQLPQPQLGSTQPQQQEERNPAGQQQARPTGPPPPPWQVRRHAAPAEVQQQQPASVEFGPALRPPPKAKESLALLTQYDDDWSSHGDAADGAAVARVWPDPVAGQASPVPTAQAPGTAGQQEVEAVTVRGEGADSAGDTAGETSTAPAADGGLSASKVAAEGAPPAGETEAAVDDQPPQDMLAVMQKLVAFIKKNGSRFEGMVRAKEAANPVFSFLEPTSKYHQRYRDLLTEAIGDAEANAVLPASAAPEVQAPKATHGPTAVLRGPPPSTPLQAPTAAAAEQEQGEQPVAAGTAAEPPPWARSASPAAPAAPATAEGGNQAQITGQTQRQEADQSLPAGVPPAPTPPEATGPTVTAPLTAQPAIVVSSAAPAVLAAAATAAAGAVGGLPPGAAATALGPITLPPWLKEKMIAAAAGAASGGSTTATTTAATPSVRLQANPSITKLATVKQGLGPAAGTAAAPAGGASSIPGASEGAAAATASPAASSPALSSESGPAAGAEAEEGGGEEGPPRSRSGGEAKGDAELAEEEGRKKAERRRRARELLVQRQQQAALAAARQRQQQLSAISIHRAAFLAADEEPLQLEIAPAAAGGAAVGAERSAAQRGLPPRPGRHSAAATLSAIEDVEEGEILPAVADAPALASEAARPGADPGIGHAGSSSRPQSRGAETRASAGLPLLEDLVSQRMHRASSGDALASSAAAAGPSTGQARAPQQHPEVTIAGHRAAFGSEASTPGAGRSRVANAAHQQQQAQQAQQGVGAEPPLGAEASLHLRRIRDRIAAITGSASKAAGSGGAARAAGLASRESPGVSGRPLASLPRAPSMGTTATGLHEAGGGISDGEASRGRGASGPTHRSRDRSPSSASSAGSGTSSDDSSSRRRSRPTSRIKSRSPSSRKRHKQQQHSRHGSRERKRHRRRHHSKSRGRSPAADGVEERGHRRRHSHKDTKTRRLQRDP